jgi:hypothetical protein
MATEASRIPKLKGQDGYQGWAIQVKFKLRAMNAWLRVSGIQTTPTFEPGSEGDKDRVKWAQTDEDAMALISQLVDIALLKHIADCETAKAMWDIFEQMFKESGNSFIMSLILQFEEINQTNYPDLLTFTNEFNALIERLEKQGIKKTELEKTMKFMAGLDDSFANWKQMKMIYLRQKNAAIPSLLDLVNEVLDEERSRKHTSTALVLYKKDTGNNTGKGPKRYCKICRTPRHGEDTCWKKHPELLTPEVKKRLEESRKQREKNQEEKDKKEQEDKERKEKEDKKDKNRSNVNLTAYSLLSDGQSPKDLIRIHGASWYLDSAATEHMCVHRHWFEDDYTEGNVIFDGAGGGLKAVGYGTVKIPLLRKDGSVITATIQNVKHVPTFWTNLISVFNVEHKGLYVDGRTNTLRTRSNNEEIGHYVWQNKLQKLEVDRAEHSVALASISVSAETWHRRLAHTANIDQASKVVRGLQISSKDGKTACRTCIRTNIQRKVSRIPMTRASAALELTHIDIVGPISPAGINGYQYLMDVTDDKTRAKWCYTLKRKNEAFGAIKMHVQRLETQTGKKFKRFRIDNGTEFGKSKLDEFFSEKGVALELTVPYTPEQNGVSERSGAMLCRRARAMIIDSGLPESFWPLAVCHSAYILNRTPTAAVKDMTPIEAFVREVFPEDENPTPNVSHLRVWGCDTFVLIPKEKRQKSEKFKDRSRQGKLVGYEAQNIHKVYMLDTRKVERHRDVVFDEGIGQQAILNDIQESVTEDESEDEETHFVTLPFDMHSSDDEEDEPEAQIQTQTPAPDAQIEAPAPIRRSGRTTKAPVRFDDEYAATIVMASVLMKASQDLEPLTYEQAMASAERDQWQKAMKEEINSLSAHNVWTMMDKPDGFKVLKSKWVFKKKRDSTGKIVRYKARFVAKGFAQQEGVDYQETFATVVASTTTRLLLALACYHNWEIEQVDFDTAFLNSPIDVELYIEAPKGFKTGSQVCWLHKCLYGLKQAGNRWAEALGTALLKTGFVNLEADQSVYVRGKFGSPEYVVVTTFVDDLHLIGPEIQQINQVKQELAKEFKIKDIGPSTHYLGMRIDRDREKRTLILNQRLYITKILTEVDMNDCRSVSLPIASSLTFSEVETPKDILQYQKMVGLLTYAANQTRPDIAFATGKMAWFNTEPSEEHHAAVRRIFRYLKSSPGLAIKYDAKKGVQLSVYADAAFNCHKGKSVSGTLITICGGPVHWKSKKQAIVALSSMEAEYIAAGEAARDLAWIQQLMSELGFDQEDPTNLHTDSKSAIDLADKRNTGGRSRHIDLRYHYMRQQVRNGRIKMVHMATTEMPADGLTKGLEKVKFKEFIKQLRMEES